MKIIAFPFAGGNKYSFDFVRRMIAKRMTVLEYSGRGQRIKESLNDDLEAIIDDAFEKLTIEIKDDDYVIYGHSMGSLVGYLVCQRIEYLGLRKPSKLIVSGRKAPSIKNKKQFACLPDSQFWEEVVKMGGIPDELAAYPELIEYFIPILKADFKCIENYQYDKKAPQLTIPIDVFYGSDEKITQEEADAWKEETSGNVNITELQGNHFFIFDHKTFFMEYFKNLHLNAIV